MGTDHAGCIAGDHGRREYFVDPHPGPQHPVPRAFADLMLRFEQHAGCPVWLLCQRATSDENSYDFLGSRIADTFLDARRSLGADEHIMLLIDSPGGQAKHAYRAAQILAGHGGFTAVVPRRAKSAATLLSIGADVILLGEYSELGPLDVQVWDSERERYGSALDEVQSLERLHVASLESVDQAMYLLVRRTRKRTNVLLPMVLKFISDMMLPLLDKTDAVHYTEVLRQLKEGEEYARRCLQSAGYSEEDSVGISARLVNDYPVHDFAIGRHEAEEIGLRIRTASQELSDVIEELVPFLRTMSAVGVLRELGDDDGPEDSGAQGEEASPSDDEDIQQG